MPEESRGFLRGLFSRDRGRDKSRDKSRDLGPDTGRDNDGDKSRDRSRDSGRDKPAVEELTVSQATVGLCFDFERGISFINEFLSDAGLKHILTILKRHGLHATFNCPAKLCETVPDYLTGLVERGHEICILGHAGETPKELTDDAIKQLLFSCRTAFAKLGLRPIGFRSPHSGWDDRLGPELLKQGFRYSAEHDHAKHPYILLRNARPLVRIPVTTTDRGLIKREEIVQETLAKHHRRLRQAIQDRHFVAVCFHPWILAETKDRMQHWEVWLETAMKCGVRLGPLADVLPNAKPESQEGSPPA